MENEDGVILTDPSEIAKEALNHYEKLLENKTIKESYQETQVLKEKLCEARLKVAANTKTEPWSQEDVIIVMRHLKNKKSRDPYGYANEIFKQEVAGQDMIKAVTMLMNKIKDQQKIPDKMKLCNITSIYKNKGHRKRFGSYRGVFRVTVLRQILDRLIYNDTYETIDENLSDCNVGCRKGRNIRDNLFVLNAVLNNVKNKADEAVDIGVYDVKKCFDTMWNQEALNDIYELGLRNDKLSLLALENESAEVAVKTSAGVTERKTIRNSIMQGTVWAGLMCTATMDKLGKEVYKTPQLIYKYKGTVNVPPLEMVDDVLTISKCGATSVAMNRKVNSFMESKKLELNSTKCAQIHVGKKCDLCPELKVHETVMKRVEQEKYLGDIVHQNGKSNATIVERLSKGNAIVTNIKALIKDIPLGNRRIQIGIELRNAWFINGILYNSEVWPQLTQKSINDLCKLDQQLLRAILGAHSKVPIEMLYLETATLQIPQIITSRRLMYLQTIVQRSDEELTKRVYTAMKTDPITGDWCELIQKDFDNINLHISEEHIRQMEKTEWKKLVNIKVRSTALEILQTMQQKHSKVKEIEYTQLSAPQEYLDSNTFTNEECSLMFNLRCRTVEGFKDNFHGMSGDGTKCDLCEISNDSQEHLMECPVLEQHMRWDHTIQYDYIFGNREQQRLFIRLYSTLLAAREELLEERRRPPGASYTGPAIIHV